MSKLSLAVTLKTFTLPTMPFAHTSVAPVPLLDLSCPSSAALCVSTPKLVDECRASHKPLHLAKIDHHEGGAALLSSNHHPRPEHASHHVDV